MGALRGFFLMRRGPGMDQGGPYEDLSGLGGFGLDWTESVVL